MHNARILSCHRLSDLCISPTSEEFEQHSKRLHLLMSLYGRELSAVVLLVGRDPLWHIKNRTAFSQLCEQSVELHFDSLAMQLKQIEEKVNEKYINFYLNVLAPHGQPKQTAQTTRPLGAVFTRFFTCAIRKWRGWEPVAGRRCLCDATFQPFGCSSKLFFITNKLIKIH